MLILIAPKFHPRHSRPRATDTDSATIPAARRYYFAATLFLPTLSLSLLPLPIPYIYSRLLLLLAATLPSLIIFTAVIAVAAAPFIIFSLPPAAIRLLLMPPAPLSPTIIAAATAAHCHCCRCREYNRCYRHRRYYSNTITTDAPQCNRRCH